MPQKGGLQTADWGVQTLTGSEEPDFHPGEAPRRIRRNLHDRVQFPGEVPEGLLADGVGGIHRAD